MSIFFKDNSEQKEYNWKIINRIFPKFKTGGYYFRKYLNNHMNNNLIVLDAGCGDRGIISEFKNKFSDLIGVDVNKKLLEKNLIITKKINANLESIPLKNNSIDIVVSEFVLEHVKNPKKVFREIDRVLKSGGVFIFLTPNILNPIMMISKFLPCFLHNILRVKILKKEEETHKTYYKINTYKKIYKLGKQTGFKEIKIKRAGNPEYLGFCRLLVYPSVFLEKIINNKILGILKMYLVGCFIKK